MKTEYEATFPNVNKDEIRERLKKAGAVLTRPEFLQKRYAIDLHESYNGKKGWIRVRDEGDKTTLSYKYREGDNIDSIKEHTITVNDMEETRIFLNLIGCQTKAYQETKREIWILEEAEITIDEWPYLEPFVEIEAESEAIVKKVSAMLGFAYGEAIFGPVSILYSKKYNIPERVVNFETPRITFEEANPFEK